MFEFLKKSFRKSHIDKSKCIVLPIISDKSELVDGKVYRIFKTYGIGRVVRWYLSDGKWNKKFDCFTNYSGEILNKFEDGDIFVLEKSINELPLSIMDYDPRTVNALDLQEIKDITFNQCDDNTQDDDVWNRLINYFDERGLSD